MGTGCSKEVVRTSSGTRGASLGSFCFGGCSYSLDRHDDREQRKQNGRMEPCGDQTTKESDQIKQESSIKGPTAVCHERTYSNISQRIASSSEELQLGPPTSVIRREDQVMPFLEDTASHAMSELAGNGPSQACYSGTAQNEPRHAYRMMGAMEPLQTGTQFSRALSVGRLRDRVLQRNSSSVALFNHTVDDDGSRDVAQGNMLELCNSTAEVTFQTAETPQISSSYDFATVDSAIRSTNSSHQLDVDNQQSVDATNGNPSSHRMTFLERRQRVRSQVRALQRLGSRFENLVGHDRSCILSGQHRRGRCLCRTNIRTDNTEGDTNTRASISRIVMLAEALFDVLDEIHQQSVVLSSWPSVSSLGSVPAPKEVVEHLPVMVYAKSGLKNEEAVQCYICLVEYDEGDCLRILPCQHMFHQSCIDKWLKEIHRVCPLCRGNICTSDSLPVETVD